MSKRSDVSIFAALGGERENRIRGLLAINAGKTVKMVVLGVTLSLAAATVSFAQSYDPDIGSGNVRGGRYGRSYFGGIHPTWRAMVFARRRTHIRRHRHR